MGALFSRLFGRRGQSGDTSSSSSPSDPSRVLIFHSSEEWQQYFNSIKDSNKLLVVDFAASWCPPCKIMEPVVKAMANKFTDVEFAKIDVEELADVSQQFGVEAMPTFVLFKQGKELDRVVGAEDGELRKMIQKHRS